MRLELLSGAKISRISPLTSCNSQIWGAHFMSVFSTAKISHNSPIAVLGVAAMKENISQQMNYALVCFLAILSFSLFFAIFPLANFSNCHYFHTLFSYLPFLLLAVFSYCHFFCLPFSTFFTASLITMVTQSSAVDFIKIILGQHFN